MSESLRRLLEGAFDHAGLLPPAALEPAVACAQFARLRNGVHGWLANRFACPIELLEELPPLLKAYRQDVEARGPWRLAVQGTTLEAFKHDLWAIERFEEEASPWAEVSCFETRVDREEGVDGWLRHLANAGFDEAYIDVPCASSSGDLLAAIAQAGSIGARLRISGVGPAPSPQPSELAATLQECLNLDVPVKLVDPSGTPLYRFDEPTASIRHGFVNAMVALCLADVHDLSRKEMEQVLTEEDAKAFWFSSGGLGWRELEASNTEVASTRGLLASIGTSSVDSAAANLRDAGFLRDPLPA